MFKKTVVTIIMAIVCILANGNANAEPAYNFVRIQGLPEQEVGEKLLFEVYKRLGIEITIVAEPGKRALEDASNGKKDGETLRIFAIGEKFPTLIRVPTPLSELLTSAFVLEGADIKITTPADLKNYSLAMTRGVAHTVEITAGITGVHEVDNEDSLMKLVEIGRKQVALTSKFNGEVVLKKLKINKVVAIEPPLKVWPLYHYIHESKAKDLVPKVEAMVKSMVDSGEMLKLRQQFEQEILLKL